MIMFTFTVVLNTHFSVLNCKSINVIPMHAPNFRLHLYTLNRETLQLSLNKFRANS